MPSLRSGMGSFSQYANPASLGTVTSGPSGPDAGPAQYARTTGGDTSALVFAFVVLGSLVLLNIATRAHQGLGG